MATVKRFQQNPGNSAIAYYRYSSEAQRDVSIDQQQEAAHTYAAAHDLEIVREYIDRAQSGTKDDRKEYTRMLAEVETLRPAACILWKTDRLSRDRVGAVVAKKRLRDCGVRIHYVAEAMPDDEATEVLLEAIYEGLAASFITSHSQNVRRGLDYNANRCLYNGVRLLGYTGTPDQPYEINEAEAAIVRYIFSEYTSGASLRKIRDNLNGQGLRSVRGNPFTSNSLNRILQNPAYIGVYRWGNISTPGGLPAIIEPDTFAAAQKRLQANKRGGRGCSEEAAAYWLAGCLTCGECGSTLQGVSGTSRSGRVFYYYSCQNHRRGGCTLRNKRRELLEGVLAYVLAEIVQEPENRLLVASECFAYYQAHTVNREDCAAAMAAQLQEIDGKVSNLVAAIEAGRFSAAISARLEELEQQRDMLSEALQAEQLRNRYALTLDDVVKWFDAFADELNTPERLRDTFATFVEAVHVYDDRVVVLFKYTGEAHAYNLGQVSALIQNRESILGLFDRKEYKGNTSPDMLEGVAHFFP